MDQKLENLLNISLSVTDQELNSTPELSAGVDTQTDTFELILKYTGDFQTILYKFPQIKGTELLCNYAIAISPRESVEILARDEQIIYVEKSKYYYYTDVVESEQSQDNAQINNTSELQGNTRNNSNTPLTGKGVLCAIIDSGIDIESPEFRDEQGNSRIDWLWNQDVDDNIYNAGRISRMTSDILGTQYNNAEINEAIAQGIELAPDTIGHGKYVARVAAGNNGVAGGSRLIVVKLGVSRRNGFPRTTQVMLGIDYAVRKALEANKPIAINLSFGNNYGAHDGNSILERYIDEVSMVGQSCICIGAGNEALGRIHASAVVNEADETEIELTVGNGETGLTLQIWLCYQDEMMITLTSPSGISNIITSPDAISEGEIRRFSFGATQVIVYNGAPSPYSTRQEVYVDFNWDSGNVPMGIWKINITPISIKCGRLDIWLPTYAGLAMDTGFTRSDKNLTMTIPAYSRRAITVGAFDSNSNRYAEFSGRGYVGEAGAEMLVKPDIVAAGVDINVGGNIRVTGTSYAVAHITGIAALEMERGIVRGEDAYMFGEKVKAKLIKDARSVAGESMPSEKTGWGRIE